MCDPSNEPTRIDPPWTYRKRHRLGRRETFSSFVLTPLTFLGGVFYSINTLPDLLRSLSMFNPLLFMINGMRYGVLGISDVNILFSMVSVA